MSMTRDDLVRLLQARRNNEVKVKISDTGTVLEIKSVRYNASADMIFLHIKPYEFDVVDDLVGILRELDDLAKEYGIGCLPKYEDIKKRAADTIGCTVEFISRMDKINGK